MKVARLFADENHIRSGRPRFQHRLGGMPIQITVPAALCGTPERG
jgi:hypothetical protein